ncbi:MAG: sodium:proton exchanger [Planctomycetes bacterium]|nr:sodium:proton exchanger [Planctomycetota bacterium]
MEHTLYLLVLIVAAGVGAQWLASRLRVPPLLLLLMTGLVLGKPVLGWIDPEQLFVGVRSVDGKTTGVDLLRPLVAMAVALVLFEGGLTLEIKEARQVGRTLRRLLVSGLCLGFGLTTLAGVWLGGLDLATAATLGAILVVTGPTVILPMLRSARIALRPATLLKWEGIVNDPLGALLALFVVKAAEIVGTGQGTFSGLAMTFVWTGSVSIVVGVAAGWALGKALDRGLIAENLKSPVIVASVLVVFAVAEHLHHEMGLISVTVMGVVLANVENHSLEDIRRFKEQITTLLIAVLFIVLSARLEPEQISSVVGRPLILIAIIVFVVRPLVVFVAAIGSKLPWRERLLVGWIAPRGVVAAAVAATFAPGLEVAGAKSAGELVPIVFGVIVATVVLHGLTIRPLARRLGLAATDGNGVLIVGASVWVVTLAQALAKAGAYVVLADTRYRRVSQARQEGVEVHYGDVLAEEAAMELPMERVSWLLAATDDDHYNALACLRFGPELGREAMFQLTPHRGEPGTETQVHMAGQRPWGDDGTYRTITARFWKGATFKVTNLSDEFDGAAFRDKNPDALVLCWVHQDHLRFADAADAMPPDGARVVYLD